MSRKGVLVEEIPPGEERLIGVGCITTEESGLRFTPLAPNGEVYGRSYRLSRGITTIWLRVSVREVAEIGYSRRIGVTIDWSEGGTEYSVSLATDPEDAEVTSMVPTIGKLLDF